MKELLTTILTGKITYGTALGLLALAGASYWYGLITPIEAVTLVLNGLGLAGLRRGVSNGQNDLTRLLLQTALVAQNAKKPPAENASDAP